MTTIFTEEDFQITDGVVTGLINGIANTKYAALTAATNFSIVPTAASTFTSFGANCFSSTTYPTFQNKCVSIDLSNCTSLLTIGEKAFYQIGVLSDVMTTLSLPSSLTQIGVKAFESVGKVSTTFTQLDLSNTSVTKIDANAFQFLDKVTTLAFPKATIVTIGTDAFSTTTDSAVTTIISPTKLFTVFSTAFVNRVLSTDSAKIPVFRNMQIFATTENKKIALENTNNLKYCDVFIEATQPGDLPIQIDNNKNVIMKASSMDDDITLVKIYEKTAGNFYGETIGKKEIALQNDSTYYVNDDFKCANSINGTTINLQIRTGLSKIELQTLVNCATRLQNLSQITTNIKLYSLTDDFQDAISLPDIVGTYELQNFKGHLTMAAANIVLENFRFYYDDDIARATAELNRSTSITAASISVQQIGYEYCSISKNLTAITNLNVDFTTKTLTTNNESVTFNVMYAYDEQVIGAKITANSYISGEGV